MEVPIQPLWWDGLNVGPPAQAVDMDIDNGPIIYYDLPNTSILYEVNTLKANTLKKKYV